MKTIFVLLLFLLLRSSYAQEVIQLDNVKLDEVMNSHKGKPVLVNLWATWCKPCVEEFPELLKIREEYKDKSLEVVLISLDFGDDAKERTTNFLKKMGVDFESYSNAFKSDEDLINYFDMKWNGGIPATFIYDKSGKLSSSMIGKRTYEDFKKEVEKVM